MTVPDQLSPTGQSSEEEPIKALRPRWQTRAVVIRVGAYMVGAHLFAAFLFLLFEVGARHSH